MTKALWRRLVPPVLVLLALNGLVFAAYTVPRALQVRNAKARAADVRRDLDRERAATAALRRQAETIRANAADTERFYKEVVVGSRAELIPLLEEVDKIATAPGFKPSTRAYQYKEVKGADLTRVGIGVSVEGSYAQLVGFLDRVERSPRFLTIDRIGLTGGTGASSPSLRVELSTYLRGKQPAKDSREGRRG